MTPFVLNKLKKLCEKPDIFTRAVEYWDFKPQREQEAIRRILAPFYLEQYLTDTKLFHGSLFGPNSKGTALSFKTKDDPCEYILFGILMEDYTVHVGLAKRDPTLLN